MDLSALQGPAPGASERQVHRRDEMTMSDEPRSSNVTCSLHVARAGARDTPLASKLDPRRRCPESTSLTPRLTHLTSGSVTSAHLTGHGSSVKRAVPRAAWLLGYGQVCFSIPVGEKYKNILPLFELRPVLRPDARY